MIIVSITVLCLILSNMFFPIIKVKKIEVASFWLIALIGALFLVGTVDLKSLFSLDVNPFEILILFISITIISIVLDELGFFILLAERICSKATSQKKLFTSLFCLISFLTIFTSNDIVILTFTPFIIALTKRLNVNPIPYLFSEFVAANTFSLMFLIGNPTNILIGLTFKITFIDYFKVMAIPSIIGGISSYFICLILFKSELKKEITVTSFDSRSYDYRLIIVSVIHLAVTTILLAISSLINIEMWLVCLVFAGSICLILLSSNRAVLMKSLKRAPWSLVPFIISMFIIVIAINDFGYSKMISEFLLDNSSNSDIKTVFVYGFSSIMADNLVNNIPMSLLFTNVLDGNNLLAIYSVIIGSNIGAYLTPIGALAGVMWMNTLKKNNVSFSFFKFIKLGFLVVLVVSITMLMTLLFMI